MNDTAVAPVDGTPGLLRPDRRAFAGTAVGTPAFHGDAHAGNTGAARPDGTTTSVVRPFLMQAGGLITAKEAERRVLILENPGSARP